MVLVIDTQPERFGSLVCRQRPLDDAFIVELFPQASLRAGHLHLEPVSVGIVHDDVDSVFLPRIPSRGLDANPLATVTVQPLKDMGSGQDRAPLALLGLALKPEADSAALLQVGAGRIGDARVGDAISGCRSIWLLLRSADGPLVSLT